MIWAENKMDLIMMWITEDLSAAIVQKTVVVPAPLWSAGLKGFCVYTFM